MADELDPYRMLGVAPGASLLEIARAHRRLAKLHHPDLAAGEAAAAEMARINAAWTLLSDAGARAAWDRASGIGPRDDGPSSPSATWAEWAYPPPTPPAPAAVGSGRNAPLWILAAFVVLLALVVAGGVVSTFDRPPGADPAPWLQDNLDR